MLTRREVAFLEAAATATFPPGGAIAASGADANVGAYTDRWMGTLHPRMRRLMRLLFFLVEHATLFFPAPGWRGFRRFSALLPGQQSAALEGWAHSPLRVRRLQLGRDGQSPVSQRGRAPLLGCDRRCGCAQRVLGLGSRLLRLRQRR